MKKILKLFVVMVFATIWWSCTSDESEVLDPEYISECQSRAFDELPYRSASSATLSNYTLIAL